MLKTAHRPAWQIAEFDKPIVTASSFGFMPIACPKITEVDIRAASHCLSLPHYDAVEKAALIRTYLEEDFHTLPHPLALVYRKPAVKKRFGGYGLHYIGALSGIAEAALIRTALSILTEEGYKNMRVEVNCVGDRESLSAYERELSAHIRKSPATLSPEFRESLKEDVFNLFRREEEEAIELRSSAPSSINFLSTQARNHFKEVLEFIEGLGIEFRLAPELVGEKNHTSHTVFGIRAAAEDREVSEHPNSFLALGYRYSRLGKRLGMRKEVPMASVNIFSSEKKEATKKIYKELPKPKYYLIQLGQEAKIKTLSLIELLRREHISVHHFLGRDKLSVQLGSAETLRVPYLIIIGHKEALEGTATVRNMSTRAQDTIPMGNLPQYLKKISL